MGPAEARRVARRAGRIDGYISHEALMLLALLDEAQKTAGIEGDLFEIGAHHGRSTVMLDAMRRPGEHLRVCDLFAAQSLNVSGSGHGDRQVFETNVAGATVLEKSSLELAVDETGTNNRIFHIDGGHLYGEALSDLRLAERATIDAGLIVLDDAFGFHFPGVTEAMIDFLRDSDVEPLFFAFNKLAMTRRPDIYRASVTSPWPYFQRRFYRTRTLAFTTGELTVVDPWFWTVSPRIQRATAWLKWLRVRLS